MTIKNTLMKLFSLKYTMNIYSTDINVEIHTDVLAIIY